MRKSNYFKADCLLSDVKTFMCSDQTLVDLYNNLLCSKSDVLIGMLFNNCYTWKKKKMDFLNDIFVVILSYLFSKASGGNENVFTGVDNL